MILSGKDLSAKMKAEMAAQVAEFPVQYGRVPHLVVILTHAVPEDAAVALAPILGGNVTMFQDSSTCYGFPRWDSWRRACQANGVARLSAVAVTGSGYGVRSAMLAGMSSMAVVKERTAYQDFTGADEVVKDLSVASARRVIARLFR